MINYIAPGTTLDYTNSSGAALASGAGVLVGTRLGIANDAIAISAVGVVYVEGVFSVNKLSTDVVTQGAKLYWDNTNKRLTTTSAGNTECGWAYAAASGTDTVVSIKLLG